MEKYIHVTKENREFLKRAFKVSAPTVARALTFNERGGMTEKAARIRSLAQQRGGILMVATPWMETFHDADNYMRQYCPNGVLIELDKNTGRGELLRDGRVLKRYEHVMVDQIPAIQAEAEKLHKTS